MRPLRAGATTATVVVALAILGTIAVIAWMFTIVRNEPSPVEPTQPPVATGTPVSTPVASPESTPAFVFPDLPLVTVERIDRGTLPELLRYTPDRLRDESLPLSDVASYANIEEWMEARDIAVPEGPDDPAYAEWEAELDSLAIPNVLATRGNDQIWVDTYGFRLSDVDQVLAVGQAPDLVLVMRGDFNAEELQDAWVESGYQAIRGEDLTLWSLFPGDSVDLSAPASRPALGNMNNVVLLDDGTLIATSRLPRLEQAVRAWQGEEPSLDENPQVAALLGPGRFPSRLETAIILKGGILVSDPGTPVVMASPAPVSVVGGASPAAGAAGEPPQLPQASLLLAGLEAPAGPDTEPVFSMTLLYPSANDAVHASIRASRALRESVSPVTGEPYRERVLPRTNHVYASGEESYLMVLTATLPRGTEDWLLVLDDRDLGFVMWPWTP